MKNKLKKLNKIRKYRRKGRGLFPLNLNSIKSTVNSGLEEEDLTPRLSKLQYLVET